MWYESAEIVNKLQTKRTAAAIICDASNSETPLVRICSPKEPIVNERRISKPTSSHNLILGGQEASITNHALKLRELHTTSIIAYISIIGLKAPGILRPKPQAKALASSACNMTIKKTNVEALSHFVITYDVRDTGRENNKDKYSPSFLC